MSALYNEYSSYLKGKYGEKVYKIPVNIPVTCPNRDGTLGYGGCTFCAEDGAGFELLDAGIPVAEQMRINKEYIASKYKAGKFIAYFQNYTNTYLDADKFDKYLRESVVKDVVGIAVSTRPDCISDEHLRVMNEISLSLNVDITVELGLQTANYHTLIGVNRGHTLAEFIDAVFRIKEYGFDICAHIILNLPGDDLCDTVETAKILSALKVSQVKLHSLYIMENTEMGRLYKEGKIALISKDEYEERVIEFLEHLDPKIVVQRLIGRAPEEGALFVNWGMSWWKIRDEILSKLSDRGSFQGKKSKKTNMV